ncbi:MAG: DnaJ domain-containing protein [Rhodospirillales bacterium]|nr:DnaJ domain-containing protein [Rhodospirillales bacterium]
MSYFVLGVAVLAGFLLAGNWFVSAKPTSILKVGKWLLIAVIALVVLFFVLSGRIALALWTLPVLLPWLMRARAAARMAKNYSTMSGGGGSGRYSEVSSAFLEMRLDHDSGDMDGTIRKGAHAGERLSTLSFAALTALYDGYEREDGESARLLAAFLDRMHPDWRQSQGPDASTGGDDFAAGSGSMSRDEALRILGLEKDADTAEIKAAYHRLIAGLHPDRGGSAYLAAKINEARDVLLKD